ncbi:inactive rhomboid protein 1 [Schistocerca cancellata]|uniref:inactive rhomboid protein 1 n=1 Tax=Schistocerca cancellata TaxID=274614 RepID=UPI0021173718|nr:inactive rhomboid protein 1 [Schistocerca cancellata]
MKMYLPGLCVSNPIGCDPQPAPRRSATPASSCASTSASAPASTAASAPGPAPGCGGAPPATPAATLTVSSACGSGASATGEPPAASAAVAAAAAGRLEPPLSRTEIVKQFIKRETAVFFGVEESVEEEQRLRWLERRKRLAARKWGQLRPEFAAAAAYSSSAYASQQGSAPGAPDVLPAGRPDGGVVPRWAEPPGRRKQSVATMTYSGLAYVISTLTKHRRRPPSRSRQHMRSYSLPAVANAVADTRSPPLFADEVFFDKPQPAGSTASQPPNAPDYADAGIVSSSEPLGEGGFVSSSRDQLDHRQPHLHEHYTTRERAPSWRRTPERLECITESGPEVGCSRIWSRVLDRVFDNSDRRQYGMSVLGRLFGQSMRQAYSKRIDFKEHLDDTEDHRPFFTYWVTTVQVLILIISIACYGLGPVGIDLNHRSGQVLVTSLSLQQVDYQEPANFWIGPRAADLIHLGAKFAPCMRKDAKIIKEIEKGREKERETACCIRNDDSGCVQSSQADCSVRGLRPTTTSTWKKWSAGDAGPGGRISGSVCGLDPKFCEAPASIAPYEWPDDITKWPICRKTNSFPQRFRYKDKMAEHMVCEVIGHPCCIGIHGTCRITTKEYCDFVRGYFHEEASLCSQVSCLDNVCGMIPFYAPEVPDQFYRLWTSLFLHAGVLHLAITLVIQYFLMRDLEKLTGPLRIAIIYLGSGMAGNLASAIFVPYRAEVGPAGAQFGLLACLIVEVLNVWQMLRHPDHALLKLLCITLVLFVFGLLPWVDNYAHLFGFIFGFLLSYALLPFVSFGEYDRHKKVALIWVCLLSAAFLFAALIVLFYIVPVYDCEVCTYFNCLPITRDFCSSQNINFKREEPVV